MNIHTSKTAFACKAAFAQTDITPDYPVELIGCYRTDSRSQGVLHPLCAQVLLLEYGGNDYCLITVDSLGLTTALSDQLRSLVAGELNTGISHVMLNFSHTHSAPAPLSPLNGERYYRLLCERIPRCAAAAKERLQPCKAGWALTDTAIGENRREGCSAVDNRLGGLEITDSASGQPIAVVLRITAHANTLMFENNKVSSDYFCPAREMLRQFFRCPVMLLQGAAGNVKPAGVDKICGGSLADTERIAELLLHSAEKLRFEPAEISGLRMYAKDFACISDVPSEAEANRIADEAKRLCGIDGTAWLSECERLRTSGVATQVQNETIQFFFLNGGCICGVPEEIFCEISLAASERAQAPYLFFNGYTNGCTGYLPHHEEWAKGGYETLYSYLQFYGFHDHVMPFRQNTAARLVKAASDEWIFAHK